MRTPTTVLLASMLVGCAPIGGEGGHRQPGDVDAGVTESVCNDAVVKTMDIDFSSTTAAPANLPKGCWKLNGKLTVSGSIDSLAKLGDLRNVQDLVINGAMLKTIDTPAPIEVTRSITVQNNTALTDLANIKVPDDASCATYLNSVSIVGNPVLASLGGVGGIRCVAGPVAIENNIKLTAVNLDSAVRLEGGLSIKDNTVLTQLSMQALQSISGDFAIRHNVALTNMGAMPALAFIHGSMIVDQNAALTTLPTAMNSSMPIVEGSITITNNTVLTGVGQFSHFTGVNVSIQVNDNPALDFCTEARSVGCCVPHNNITVQIYRNKANNNNNCTQHSWCYAQQNGNCYSYDWTP